MLPLTHKAQAPAKTFVDSRAVVIVTWTLSLMIAVNLLFSSDQASVLMPVVVAVATAAWLYLLLFRINGFAPLMDVGAFYLGAVFLYSVFPPWTYVLNDFQYGLESDYRLYLLQPDPATVSTVSWYYVVHLLAFALSYGWIRASTRRMQPSTQLKGLPVSTLVAVVTLLGLISVYMAVLGSIFDLTYETYIESYLVLSRMPLLLAQATNHLLGMQFILKLVFMLALCLGNGWSRLVLVLWLSLEALLSTISLGSRTELLLLLLAATVAYHQFVKRIPTAAVVAAAALMITAFLAWGTIRDGGIDLSENWLRVFTSRNEFDAVFATAIEVSVAKQENTLPEIPPQLYVADLTALVPQQVLPFERSHALDWYSHNFHPGVAAEGGGYGFGSIAEAIIGLGWIEALLRGAFIGLVFAYLHQWYSRRANSLWPTVLYLWIAVCSYRMFRHTTLYLLAPFVYEYIPTVIAVVVSARAYEGWRTRFWGAFGGKPT